MVDDDSYEELLSLWADLEAGLGTLLTYPTQVPDLAAKLAQYDQWMQALLQHDSDFSLYLLFQLATTSTIGYSTTHALVCAALCHLSAPLLGLDSAQRSSLVLAAMTMNIAMTHLQDTLAQQKERPSPEQQQSIDSHARRGRALLAERGIDNLLWLDTVALHHQEPGGLTQAGPAGELAALLQTVDRYAAMISPRQSRAGGSAADSVRAVNASRSGTALDPMGQALLRLIGLHPPGTFVRLDSGPVAVVLRRAKGQQQPLVASVLDAQGHPIHPPKLQLVSSQGPRIKTGLPRSAVLLDLNQRTMVRLGIFAASQPGQHPAGQPT